MKGRFGSTSRSRKTAAMRLTGKLAVFFPAIPSRGVTVARGRPQLCSAGKTEGNQNIFREIICKLPENRPFPIFPDASRTAFAVTNFHAVKSFEIGSDWFA